MTFVKNAWYVAGWSRDFGDALRALRIVDQDLVMFRASSGAVVALEDRCPHRLLPLSMRRRVGDAVQCGYHGMTFDRGGRCVRVPGQSNLPASAHVDAYRVEERHGVVWVWMGAPERADPSRILDLPQFSDPGWHVHHGGALHLDAHSLNVAENLVDPAHISFVHPTTLGNASSEDVPVHVSTRGEAITAWRWIRDARPVGFFRAFGGFAGNVDRWHYYHLHLPSTAVIDFGSADAGLSLTEDERDRGVWVLAIHFVTPVDEDRTVDHWMHLRNAAVGDEAASERMDALLATAFAEDKAILEAVHRSERRPQRRRPVRIAIDKGPNVYRRRIRELIEAEVTEDLGPAEAPALVHHD